MRCSSSLSPRAAAGLVLTALLTASGVTAKPAVTVNRAANGSKFESIPAPAINDAAAKARIRIIEGRRDGNGGDLPVLTDGRLPASEDDPAANFFFTAGTDGGRIALDLGTPTAVGSIATYSRHRGNRAPQVYTVWAASGDADFDPAPRRPLDPAKAGWTLLAEVDTRHDGTPHADRHAALVSDPTAKSLGTCRHLLFDLRRTDDRDRFGNTFLSEIDVTDAKAPAPDRIKTLEPIIKTFTSRDKKFRYTVNVTKAPDLAPWAAKELIPVVGEWYPKMIAMMPSPGYTAPTEVFMEFKDDMGGTPAYASGNRVSLSIPFFRRQLKGEAKGCVIHELVHVIQNFGLARRTNRNATRTPGWVTEGLADYVRWFLFEPELKGAEITRRNLKTARHDGSYRISANFLDWVVRKHDQNLLQKLNATAREGRYDEKLWKTWTGKSLDELDSLWLDEHRKRLGANGN